VPVLRAQRQASEAPSATGAAQEAAAQAALAELEARLARRPGRLAALKVLVDLSRKYLLLRENQRFQFDRVQHAQQRTLLWLGGRLAARGALQAGADIRWLSWDEVQGLVQGTFEPPEARRAVEARRRRWEADREEPPVFLVGDQAGAVPPDAARIEALGISPGRVRGRVRIVRTLADGHKLQAGEILVSRAVDPSWTPLFMVAGGVILELGSRLSHGAVVAREYGVPAVVNVEGVFRRFHDGQEVTVDGGRGVIWLHEPGP
jgi:pyruvate,water dikinase